MTPLATQETGRFTFSPLVLADRLLDLAHEADRAGYVGAAERLVTLAFAVYDEKPPRPA